MIKNLNNKKVVAGLGNPGRKYKNTRHNAGLETILCLVEKYKGKFKTYKNNLIELCNIKVYNQTLTVLKPLTYMNLSGGPISRFIFYNNIDLNNFLLIYDDVDIPLGRIRIKSGGGSGGHKGVKSVINEIGQDFPRLKIGISHPGDSVDVPDYVLNRFKSKEEKEILQKSIYTAVEVVECWAGSDLEKAMCSFN